MIFIDTPQRYPKYGRCAHLVSDQRGQAGTDELLAFAKRIGLRREWLQKPGTYGEHFDAMRSRIERAIEAGARPVSRRKLGALTLLKRDDLIESQIVHLRSIVDGPDEFGE